MFTWSNAMTSDNWRASKMSVIMILIAISCDYYSMAATIKSAAIKTKDL